MKTSIDANVSNQNPSMDRSDTQETPEYRTQNQSRYLVSIYNLKVIKVTQKNYPKK